MVFKFELVINVQTLTKKFKHVKFKNCQYLLHVTYLFLYHSFTITRYINSFKVFNVAFRRGTQWLPVDERSIKVSINDTSLSCCKNCSPIRVADQAELIWIGTTSRGGRQQAIIVFLRQFSHSRHSRIFKDSRETILRSLSFFLSRWNGEQQLFSTSSGTTDNSFGESTILRSLSFFLSRWNGEQQLFSTSSGTTDNSIGESTILRSLSFFLSRWNGEQQLFSTSSGTTDNSIGESTRTSRPKRKTRLVI